MAQVRIDNFIAGKRQAPAQGEYYPIYEPKTGKQYGQLANSTSEDVDAAVAAAKAAFPVWSAMTDEARSKVMLRVADLIEQRLDEFAAAESKDQGKTLQMARTVDIPRAVTNFRFFATALLHHKEESTVVNGTHLNYTLRQPVGVAALISPWNLPLYLLTWKIAPAIAPGNTVVAKPSEFTSVTASMLADVCVEAGMPPGTVNIVFGQGHRCGQPLVAHPDTPLVSFTGGTATGEKVSLAAAKHFKRTSLELGGKNASIVFADADLAAAVPTCVRAAFANQGEICLCGSRIFVQRSVYQNFLDAFLAEAASWTPGTKLGALVSKQHLEKVQGYIRLAQQEGGTIALGGVGVSAPLPDGCADGYWQQATVITGLPASARCCTEEIFGPVVTITPFDTEDEVIDWNNSSQYGLAGSVWSENIHRAHRVASSMTSGYVWINCWMVRDLRVPFGGQKASGIGREGGEHSIDFYTEQKTVCMSL